MPIRGGSSVRDPAKRKWTSEDGRKHLAYQLMGMNLSKEGSDSMVLGQ